MDGHASRVLLDLKIEDPLLDPGLPLIQTIGNWAEWLAAADLPIELEAIRKSHSARPSAGPGGVCGMARSQAPSAIAPTESGSETRES